MLLNHGFAQTLRQPLYSLLLATLIGALPLSASANPPMVPQRDAQTAFGGALPARDAALLDASLASHIERQQLLNSQHLAGSQLRTLDFFNKTFTVLRGGKRTVFDAELLGTWWPESRRWAWEAVERVPDLKDPKRKSFATGSALTRLQGASTASTSCRPIPRNWRAKRLPGICARLPHNSTRPPACW